ncbi:hypothetical protein ABPG72_013354 [Tetrahymena utriculariae]
MLSRQPMDGDCFYHSLIRCLNLQETTYELKNNLADFVSKNLNSFEFISDQRKSLIAQEIRKVGEYTQYDVIRIAAEYLNKAIILHRNRFDQANKNIEVFKPKNLDTNPLSNTENCIQLLFSGPLENGHFDSIYPINSCSSEILEKQQNSAPKSPQILSLNSSEEKTNQKEQQDQKTFQQKVLDMETPVLTPAKPNRIYYCGCLDNSHNGYSEWKTLKAHFKSKHNSESPPGSTHEFNGQPKATNYNYIQAKTKSPTGIAMSQFRSQNPIPHININTQNNANYIKHTNPQQNIPNELYANNQTNLKHTDSKVFKNCLKLICWNTSSIKPNTYSIFRQVQPHLMCLQEIRNHDFINTPSFNYLTLKRNNPQGGGICMGISTQLNYKEVNHIIPQYIKDSGCEVQCTQIFHSQIQLIIINVYILSQNKFGKGKRNLMKKWITHLITEFNYQKFIICGDFNSSDCLFPQLYKLNPSEQTTFQRKNCKQSTLDHIYSSFQCQNHFASQYFKNISDHNMLIITLNLDSLKNNTQKQAKLQIPSKKLSYELCQQIETLQPINHIQFLFIMQNQLRLTPTHRTIRQTLKLKDSQKKALTDLTKIIDEFLRSKTSQISHKVIKRLSIQNQAKRDGSIVTCQIDQNNDQKIITSSNDINLNCINYLKNISDSIKEPPKPFEFPYLTPLKIEQILLMQQLMSINKAVVYDGLSDRFLKETQSYHLINDWWNPQTISMLNKNSFKVRLIPLNKVHPNIPLTDQFRPIAVQSPAIKWLELRFKQQLQDYIDKYIDSDQNGFISDSSTQMNICQLIQKIQQYSSRDKMSVLFIDLKQAYNTINRQKLFNIMSNKNILSAVEIDFLSKLYDSLYFETADGKKHHMKNGVQQGSVLSPILFNIYMNEIITKIKNQFGQDLFIKAYADDLVLVYKLDQLQQLIQALQKLFEEYELVFNNKKSQIMVINKKTPQKIQNPKLYDLDVVILDTRPTESSILYKSDFRPQATETNINREQVFRFAFDILESFEGSSDVFAIYESGLNQGFFQSNFWAPKGTHLKLAKDVRLENNSLIMLISKKFGIISYQIKQNSFNSGYFLNFLKASLELYKEKLQSEGKVSILMDNSRIHKMQAITQFMMNSSYCFYFTAPYSSAMNPTEEVFGSIKKSSNLHKGSLNKIQLNKLNIQFQNKFQKARYF